MKITVTACKDDPTLAKCTRCWKYTAEGLLNFDNLCDKCTEVMVSDYPDHESIPFIKEYWLKNNRFVEGSPAYIKYFGMNGDVTECLGT